MSKSNLHDKVIENTEEIDSSHNLIGVLFVLALIYFGLLFLAFMRTYKNVCRRENISSYRRVFTGFYAMVWCTLLLTIGLYSILTAHFFKLETNIVSTVAFYFLPLIMQVFCYLLLYFQLDLMMRKSKIESSQLIVNKHNNTTKIAHILRVMVLT
jgi:amino acid permease